MPIPHANLCWSMDSRMGRGWGCHHRIIPCPWSVSDTRHPSVRPPGSRGSFSCLPAHASFPPRWTVLCCPTAYCLAETSALDEPWSEGRCTCSHLPLAQ